MKTDDLPNGPADLYSRRLIRLWRTLRNHPAWSVSLLGALIAGAIGVFIDLAEDVRSGARITLLDQQLAEWLHIHATPGTTRFMLAISVMHNMLPIGIACIVLALLLYRHGRREWLLGLALVVPGGTVINTAFKHWMARPRPHFVDPIVTLTSFSFPSGHTSIATLFYGFVAALLISGSESRVRRWAAIIGALSMVTLVAASRMYLGAHFLTDVLAAFFESVAWLGLCLIGMNVLRRQRRWRRPGT